MYGYLKQYREGMPRWLDEYCPSDRIPFGDVMSSRVAYYPGFGSDGSMLKVGNMSHSVHSFIHLDYLNNRDEVMKQVDRVNGYHRIGHIEWRPEDLLPKDLYPFERYLNERKNKLRVHFSRHSDHHIMTDILERDDDKDDSHGARRLALTTISADGIEFYYQVFVNEYSVVPWLMLLQDHGFGCNYDMFGAGSILHRIMRRHDSWPTFIICENNGGTRIYDGYELMEDVEPVIGGMHRNIRFLYRRQIKG